MSRLEEAFNNKPVFMPYYPLGYPDLDTSIDVLEALAKNGADLVEIGFPFSDPLADGPVIQQATQIALQNGVTTSDAIKAVAEFRRRGVSIPLILMGYFNPILAYGLEKFSREASAAGIDGLIIPDLPVEECGELIAVLEDLPLINMLAPTTPEDRMEKIARVARGFIYLVSVTGVTGARTELPDGLTGLISRVKAHTSIPVCVGFGIGTPEQARQVGRSADGVIVGSACVRTIGTSLDPVERARTFAREFEAVLWRSGL